MIAYRLEGFKEKKPNELYNLRCPICGDSSKNNRKRRGFFYVRSSNLNYMCHNCGASMSFGSFLKQFDGNLHRSFLLEKFSKDKSETLTLPKVEVEPESVESTNIFAKLKRVSDLDVSHVAYQYLSSRQIPRDRWDDIYFVPNFVAWAKKHVPDKFPNKVILDHARLILPWRNTEKVATAYSARSLGSVEPKYYTIPLVEDKGFFGLDRVDFNKRIYVLEGAMDSMCLPNSVAVGTSALWKFASTNDTVYVPDKDVRNVEVMKVVKRMIDDGLSVCMLPNDDSGKDINEMVKSGMTTSDIVELIDANTHRGLSAELKFGSWCKLPMRRLTFESN